MQAAGSCEPGGPVVDHAILVDLAAGIGPATSDRALRRRLPGDARGHAIA